MFFGGSIALLAFVGVCPGEEGNAKLLSISETEAGIMVRTAGADHPVLRLRERADRRRGVERSALLAHRLHSSPSLTVGQACHRAIIRRITRTSMRCFSPGRTAPLKGARSISGTRRRDLRVFRFVSVEETKEGEGYAEFTVTHRHEDLSAPGGEPRPVLDETWRVRAVRPDGDYSIIDIVSTQTCASDSPLTINKYHYGGMAIRGTADWFINDKEAEAAGRLSYQRGQDARRWQPQPAEVGRHARAVSGRLPCRRGDLLPPGQLSLSPVGPASSEQAVLRVQHRRSRRAFRSSPASPTSRATATSYTMASPDPELLDRLWNDYANPPKVSVAE